MIPKVSCQTRRIYLLCKSPSPKKYSTFQSEEKPSVLLILYRECLPISDLKLLITGIIVSTLSLKMIVHALRTSCVTKMEFLIE